MNWEKEVKAAIIGGILVVIAAIISISPYLTNLPHTEIETSVDVVYQMSEPVNHTYLDFKVKNKGNEAAIIKSVEIKVLNSSADYEPCIVAERHIEPHRIALIVKNLGWGPAKNVTIRDLYDSSDLISVLGLRTDGLLWQGNIKEGSEVTINHAYEKDFNVVKSLFRYPFGDWYRISGRIKYWDVHGNKHTKFIGNKTIGIKDNNIYEVIPTGVLLLPSAEYKVILESERNAPYTKKIRVSHEVPPNKADRFSIKSCSDKTATYDLVAYVNYDGKSEETKRVKVKIEEPNCPEQYPVSPIEYKYPDNLTIPISKIGDAKNEG